MLWEEIAFRALKRGNCEKHAYELANEVIGKNWKERFAKALAGDLDHADEAARDMAVANAVRLTLLDEAVVKDAEDGERGGHRRRYRCGIVSRRSFQTPSAGHKTCAPVKIGVRKADEAVARAGKMRAANGKGQNAGTQQSTRV